MRFKEYRNFSQKYTFTQWTEIEIFEEKIIHQREKIKESYIRKKEIENKKKIGNFEFYDL